MQPRTEEATKVNLILGLASPEEANTLCRNEVFIDAQVFRCEPFEESLQPRQCFACFQFGHIARHCRAIKRCGHCATTAHPEGEQSCPVKAGTAQAKCILCNGTHAAWSRSCPVAKGHWDKAREAYQYRPAYFDVREPNARRNLVESRGLHEPSITVKKRGRPLGAGSNQTADTAEGISKITTQTKLTQMLSCQSMPPPPIPPFLTTPPYD